MEEPIWDKLYIRDARSAQIGLDMHQMTPIWNVLRWAPQIRKRIYKSPRFIQFGPNLIQSDILDEHTFSSSVFCRFDAVQPEETIESSDAYTAAADGKHSLVTGGLEDDAWDKHTDRARHIRHGFHHCYTGLTVWYKHRVRGYTLGLAV